MNRFIYILIIVLVLMIALAVFIGNHHVSEPAQNSSTSTNNILNSNSGNASTSNLTYKDILKIYNLKSGDTIKSPFELKGEAKGWYFEGSFPVKVVDSVGNVLTQVPAQAQGDWMSSNYVPFTAKLIFNLPKGVTSGYIILQKDNESGLPKFDDSFEVPVSFTN